MEKSDDTGMLVNDFPKVEKAIKKFRTEINNIKHTVTNEIDNAAGDDKEELKSIANEFLEVKNSISSHNVSGILDKAAKAIENKNEKK